MLKGPCWIPIGLEDPASGRPGQAAFSVGDGDDRVIQGRPLLLEILKQLLELLGSDGQLLERLRIVPPARPDLVDERPVLLLLRFELGPLGRGPGEERLRVPLFHFQRFGGPAELGQVAAVGRDDPALERGEEFEVLALRGEGLKVGRQEEEAGGRKAAVFEERDEDLGQGGFFPVQAGFEGGDVSADRGEVAAVALEVDGQGGLLLPDEALGKADPVERGEHGFLFLLLGGDFLFEGFDVVANPGQALLGVLRLLGGVRGARLGRGGRGRRKSVQGQKGRERESKQGQGGEREGLHFRAT